MPSEFGAVEAYLSHFENKHSTSSKMVLINNSSSDMNADQKVPQLSTFALLDEDMMFCDIKTEPESSSSFFKLNDPFSFSSDVKLAPVASMNCTPVEVNDQQLTGEHSPIHQLLDLDHVNNMTFYPDTIPSAQIKQEIPDIPSGCTEYGYDPESQDSFMYSEQNQLEIVGNFVLNQARKDIEAACVSLQISPDPTEWTAEQSQSWVRLTLQQYQYSTLDAYMFLIPGGTLCQFTEAEFRLRSPDYGATLYSMLEIWKNASIYYQTPETRTKPHLVQENTYISFQDVLPRPVAAVSPCPSLSPAPSTSSLDSIGSSSASSTGFSASNNMQFDYLNTTLESDCVLKSVRPRSSEHKQTIHLWQFLKELLLQGPSQGNCIKWLDREKGIFKIEDSSRVARLWGKRKNRPAMNYDKLSRSIRQYYKKGIIKKTEHSKRLVYQFCKPYLS